MAQMAEFVGRDDLKLEVMSLYSPRKCYETMQEVTPGDNWQELQPKLMEKAVMAKFQQNPPILRALLATSDAKIVFATPFDSELGIELDENEPDVRDPTKVVIIVYISSQASQILISSTTAL